MVILDQLLLAARGRAAHVTLAALFASSLLLTPVLAQTDDSRDTKPRQSRAPVSSAAAKPAAGSPKAPVSPYVTANRQRAEASTAAASAQSTKRSPGPPPIKAKPTRAKRA